MNGCFYKNVKAEATMRGFESVKQNIDSPHYFYELQQLKQFMAND